MSNDRGHDVWTERWSEKTKKMEKLFSRKEKSVMRIGYNKVCSRKHEFLDVPTMKMLYDFWERNEAKDETGKELFFPKLSFNLFSILARNCLRVGGCSTTNAIY